jgi:hypothetical protein
MASIVAIGAFVTLTACFSRPAYAGGPADLCTLLTPAEVSTVLGANVGPGTHVGPNICGWSAPKQPNSTMAKKVMLDMSDARAYGYAKTPLVNDIKAAPASGVCDDAVYSIATDANSGQATSLYARKGSTYFVVHVYGVPDQSKTMEMEKTLAVEACSNL